MSLSNLHVFEMHIVGWIAVNRRRLRIWTGYCCERERQIDIQGRRHGFPDDLATIYARARGLDHECPANAPQLNGVQSAWSKLEEIACFIRPRLDIVNDDARHGRSGTERK